MPRRTASEAVRIARENIRVATAQCGSADLTRIQEVLKLLESAAIEMRQAEAEVGSGASRDFEALRQELGLLKRETAIMTRVVDGGAALCRGLSLRLGNTAPGYTPEGRAAVAPSKAVCEVRG